MAAIPIDLVEAVQKGEVSLEARPEKSFAETRVKLANKTSQEFEIDFSRSGLIPKTGEAQRIGLCYPIAFDPGDYVLTLKPKQQADIVFSSRCLDRQRPAPDASTAYGLISELLPDYIVDVLRQGLDQETVWFVIDRQGGSWGHDVRPVPQVTHRALVGDWEATLPNNRYRLRITWSQQENRYEGHATQLGALSADVGFSVGEFTYIATPTSDPGVLEERAKWRWGRGGVSTGEEWHEGIVDLSLWESWNIGIFYSGTRHIRVG